MTFIWPNPDPVDQLKDNDASIVSRLQYGVFSEIFTGDIDILTEEKLITANLELASTVLKVSHHGSRFATSDMWLNKVNPKLAIIGVGQNSYGHPHSDTLDRLLKHNVKINRTDKDGEIEIISDGENWWRNDIYQLKFPIYSTSER